jgi:membrane fusion protein, multidrug efflux system
MSWTHGKAWACGLAVFALAVFALAVGGGANATQAAQGQPPASEPGVERGVLQKGESTQASSRVGRAAELESLRKELEALRVKIEALVKKEEQPEREPGKVAITSPKAMDVVVTRPYVGKIHAHRHINIRALVGGYLTEMHVKSGQAVKKGDVMFKVAPVVYQSKLDAEMADVQYAQIEFNNNKKMFEDKVISQAELGLAQAKLAKAQAKAKAAEAELNFATVKAPFDGLVGRIQSQQGSLVQEGDVLATLSDNSMMWVYFTLPEVRYLEYMASGGRDKADRPIELVLANGRKLPQLGKIGAIEAQFEDQTGSIPFRADFPNPDGLMRHGQTGTVVMRGSLNNAIVIPRQAAFEILDKPYVYVVGKDDVAHLREIVINDETDSLVVIKKGLDVNDKIIFDGVRKVRDGEKVECEFRKPEEVMPNPNQPGE